MTTNKLLDRLRDILTAERRAQRARYDALKKVLKSLRQKKKKLKATLAECDDDVSRAEIQSKLKVVSAQRKKGVQLLKDLKAERKQKQSSGKSDSEKD